MDQPSTYYLLYLSIILLDHHVDLLLKHLALIFVSGRYRIYKQGPIKSMKCPPYPHNYQC